MAILLISEYPWGVLCEPIDSHLSSTFSVINYLMLPITLPPLPLLKLQGKYLPLNGVDETLRV